MTQTIEQLTARVRKLEEENARLESECVLAENLSIISKRRGELIDSLTNKLAAEQLNNKLLREALQEYIDEHEECQDADDWMAMMCSMEAHHVADEAISQPSDTSALDAYVAEKVKEYADEARRQMQHATKAVWQRDLAVEALKSCGVNDGLNGPTQYFDEDLVERAIKESEAK